MSIANIILLSLAALGGLILVIKNWKKKAPAAPVIETVVADESQAEQPEALDIPEDSYASHTEEPAIDLSSVESVDSSKPFANLKSNSVGKADPSPIAEVAKVPKKKAAKKSITATSMKAGSTDTPKKRAYRKKDK